MYSIREHTISIQIPTTRFVKRFFQCPDRRCLVCTRFSRETECVLPQVDGIAASRDEVRTRGGRCRQSVPSRREARTRVRGAACVAVETSRVVIERSYVRIFYMRMSCIVVVSARVRGINCRIPIF